MKMYKIIPVFLLTAFVAFSCGNGEGGNGGETTATTSGDTELKSDIDSLSYALGVSVGMNFGQLKDRGMYDFNIETFSAAVNSAIEGEELILDYDGANAYLETWFKIKEGEKAEANLAAGNTFLEENKDKEGVVTTETGLQYKIIREGSGPKPGPTSKVTTHYHGTLIDGTVFDSSIDRGQPAQFPVNGVIPGWTEALQLMSVGSKWKLWVPSNLAYGPQGGPGGANAMLTFEVELISIDE